MKRSIYKALALVLAVICLMSTMTYALADGARYIEGSIDVNLKQSVTVTENYEQLFPELEGKAISIVQSSAVFYDLGMTLNQRVVVYPVGQRPEDIVEAINLVKDNENVVIAEPDTYVHADVVKGDLNGDNAITNADVIMLARIIVGLIKVNEVTVTHADMNGDRVVSNSDLIILARIVVNLPEIDGEMSVFYSLEEFNDAILNAEEGGDIADLAGIDSYRLPTNLPENYKLYKITAGVVDIGFWYMPEDCLTSVNSAEAEGRHFTFIYGRDAAGSQLAEGTFIVHEGVRDRIEWNGGGHRISLYVPTDYTGDNYDELIQTETVIVK